MVSIRVLGSFEATVDGLSVPLGGPRQCAVLALLVCARGEVVSLDRMIDDLWRGEPPPQAVTSLQAYVSNLRRLLEPGRPRRAPARLLVSSSPGYALRVADQDVDAWRFEHLLRAAHERVAADPAGARGLTEQALALWRGPAFAAVADEPWAGAEVARLDELRLDARELQVAAGLRCGDAGGAAVAAEQLTRDQPLREEGWRLHALALWAGRRQADALATLRRARAVLAADVGLDPGPALVEVEEAILARREDVLRAATTPAAPIGPTAAELVPAASIAASVAASSAASSAAEPPVHADLFVGRDGELAALAATAAEVLAGRTRVALVTGEAGLGKSALLACFTARLARDGWLVATGRCPEVEDAPPAWAWVEVLRTVAETVPARAEYAAALAPLVAADDVAGRRADASVERFRMHRALRAWLADAARIRPTAVLLDDLHLADVETLALLLSCAQDAPGPPLLLVAALRPDEVDDRLTETLAGLARLSPLRLALPGLADDAVARVVADVADAPVDAATVAALTERTGGNPFYVRESARLLAGEGALVALSDVPEGVRDVLRRRFARLPQSAVAVLRLAAIVGREADVDVLVAAADTDEDGVLDALDAGLIAGLLTEPALGRVRFVHALVRDTMCADLSRLRGTRMHARIAAALEHLGSGDVTALAYHHSRAVSAATAARAVELCLRAAELADRGNGHDAAVDLRTRALECFERLPADHPGDRTAEHVDLLGRLLRAQVRAGAVTAARTTRRRAVDVAGAAGRDDLLIAAFIAWTEPSPWQTRPYGSIDEPLIAALDRLLELPDLPPVQRCRLLDAYAVELSGESEGEGVEPSARRGPRAAAREAIAIARRVGDPKLLGMTLATLIPHLHTSLEALERASLAEELIRVGDAHEIPAYRWYGRFNLAIATADLGDPERTRHLVLESLEVARAYLMPEATSVVECTLAMFASLEGRPQEAERRYAEALAPMVARGSPHAAGFGWIATAAIRVEQGRAAELASQVPRILAEYGPFVADLLAVVLAADGRTDEARRMRALAVPIRVDFFFIVLSTYRAMAVVALDEPDAAAEVYADLLPFRDAPPTAAGLSLALRPIAHTLGELAHYLGRSDEAAAHFAHAAETAKRWGAAPWRITTRHMPTPS
jgi:DNA-binding SARP family transcriptional activator